MFYFDNFSAHMPEWICNKTVRKLSASSNKFHYTYVVKHDMCQYHSNASIKRHDKLTVTDKHNAQSVCLWLWHAHFTIDCSIMCDTVLDSQPCWNRFFRHFRWMSLCMMRPTDLCKMPVSVAIWRVVLCVAGTPSWLSDKSLSISDQCSQQYQAVNLLCRFLAVF